MLNKLFVAAAILIVSPAFASAQDIFWSFSPSEVVSTSEFELGTTGSAYIFSDGLFGFDANDLEFATTGSDVIRFTGGEAFNSTYSIIGGTKFNASVLTIDAEGISGGMFSVNITENGVNPAILSLFDPDFVAGVGPNGAVLLARVDFDVVGAGSADLLFALGPQGTLELPNTILNPLFGSATLTVGSPKVLTCPGDVNLSGFVDASDIAPFIAVLASGEYQTQADCNFDNVVNFFDIASFIAILASS